VRHGEAWKRLPDLLDDRDDPGLIAHVRGCPDCQRQVFLLSRVDRLLRGHAATGEATWTRRFLARRRLASAAAVTAFAAAAALVLSLLLAQTAHPHDMVLRTASGLPVGHAAMSHSDARNESLTLTAQGLPVDGGQMFVLWASDSGHHPPMQVGPFMVDRSGRCRVHFNLPADHTWTRLWITRPGKPTAIVASA
jgi:anti-sigma-K factor RskA